MLNTLYDVFQNLFGTYTPTIVTLADETQVVKTNWGAIANYVLVIWAFWLFGKMLLQILHNHEWRH